MKTQANDTKILAILAKTPQLRHCPTRPPQKKNKKGGRVGQCRCYTNRASMASIEAPDERRGLRFVDFSESCFRLAGLSYPERDLAALVCCDLFQSREYAASDGTTLGFLAGGGFLGHLFSFARDISIAPDERRGGG